VRVPAGVSVDLGQSAPNSVIMVFSRVGELAVGCPVRVQGSPTNCVTRTNVKVRRHRCWYTSYNYNGTRSKL